MKTLRRVEKITFSISFRVLEFEIRMRKTIIKNIKEKSNISIQFLITTEKP